jgi:hypothetical protein
MPSTIGTLDTCFEEIGLTHQRWQVVSNGTGARFARQTNTSASTNTGKPVVRRWAARAELADQAQFEDLEDQWDQSRGGVFSHSWTPPDEGAAIAVRIASFRIIYAAHGRFEVALELEEDL